MRMELRHIRNERQAIMVFDELVRRYGEHVAKRVQQELGSSEFSHLRLEELSPYLVLRAEEAHREYQRRLDRATMNLGACTMRDETTEVLYDRWRTAEELSYLLAIAEDANHSRVTETT
ncbi:MAG: hypothetical protein ABTQ34_08275 [Bdellovibrionales bacterium]